MDLSELTTYTRDLTGVYSADVVSDSLIQRWINEAYNEVARVQDWDWLEATFSGALPAAVDGVHTIELDNGTRRVLSAYLIDSSDAVTEVIGTSELDHVEASDDNPRYDVTFAGVLKISPEQEGQQTVKVRYTQANVELVMEGEDEEPTSPVFDAQFHPILAYRAAAKVLAFMSDDTNRSQYYMGEYASLLDGMYQMYELDHDYRTFQLGQDGVNERRYYPWFRPA